MPFAVLFPGQGSQFVGMGGDLFEVRPDLLGDRADQILGWSLRDMCLDGPDEALTRTEHAQPALFALSVALWSELESRIAQPAASAGHSLGEYSALAGAGAVSFDDALRLVSIRGSAMARAADLEPSGMAALIGADGETAEKIAAARRDSGGRMWVANINAPGQIVVAGGSADIDWIVEHSRDHGVRRAVPLKVAGAFHSPFMAPAAQELTTALGETRFSAPHYPVWANATARPYASEISETLAAQLTGTVRFAETLAGVAASGIDRFVHVGPGDVTAGLARRSVEGTEPIVVSSLEDIDTAVAALSAA